MQLMDAEQEHVVDVGAPSSLRLSTLVARMTASLVASGTPASWLTMRCPLCLPIKPQECGLTALDSMLGVVRIIFHERRKIAEIDGVKTEIGKSDVVLLLATLASSLRTNKTHRNAAIFKNMGWRRCPLWRIHKIGTVVNILCGSM